MVLSENLNKPTDQMVRLLDKSLEIKKTGELEIGTVVRNVLTNAQFEDRTLYGLSAVVKQLKKTPEQALFCITAPSKNNDAANHMLSVLLEAYCYENDIYTIKVDNEEKLKSILKLKNYSQDVSCVLIQRAGDAIDDFMDNVTIAENSLIDFCETYWDAPEQPIIKLPEK